MFDLSGTESKSPPPEDEQVHIGSASQYREPGLYDRFLDRHRILLVSRRASGGHMLVALQAICTNNQGDVSYDDTTGLLRCRRCGSTWTTDGLIRDGSIAQRSLPRLLLRIDRTPQPAETETPKPDVLLVDPSRKYHRRDRRMVDGQIVIRQEWSATNSMYMFAQDPRYHALRRHVHSP